MADRMETIAQNLYEGQADAVAAGVREALDAGVPAAEVLNGGLIAGMDEVGRDF
jgi:methanogenic corrinoid protein MtbC1